MVDAREAFLGGAVSGMRVAVVIIHGDCTEVAVLKAQTL